MCLFPLDVIHLLVVSALVPLVFVLCMSGCCCVLRLFQLIPCFFLLTLLKLLVHSFANVAAVSSVGGGTWPCQGPHRTFNLFSFSGVVRSLVPRQGVVAGYRNVSDRDRPFSFTFWPPKLPMGLLMD